MYARRVLTERRRKTKPSVTPAGARCRRPATELRRTRYRVGLSGPDMLFVPFRDGTSGRETYGAGRYLDIRVEADDRNVLGFFAYNPYCAYSDSYSCPLPPAENWLPVRIEAGERTR